MFLCKLFGICASIQILMPIIVQQVIVHYTYKCLFAGISEDGAFSLGVWDGSGGAPDHTGATSPS